MAHVQFTPALKRFFPELVPSDIQGNSVREIIDKLEEKHPGLKSYIVDDQGSLRQHVNIFVGNEMIKDKSGLMDALSDRDEVYIMQALSGG